MATIPADTDLRLLATENETCRWEAAAERRNPEAERMIGVLMERHRQISVAERGI
jgi:hypothetical protein